MSNYAIYENDEIVNIIVADSKDIAQEVTGKKAIEAVGKISIGWTLYEDGSWRPAAPYQSWTEWDAANQEWLPPTPKPSPTGDYYWDEDSLTWEISPSPLPSWIWDGDNWIPPVPPPDDDLTKYNWDEDTQSWILIDNGAR